MSVALLPPTLLSHLSPCGDTSKLYLTSKCQGESAVSAGDSARLITIQAAEGEKVCTLAHLYAGATLQEPYGCVLSGLWVDILGVIKTDMLKVQVVSSHSMNSVLETFRSALFLF